MLDEKNLAILAQLRDQILKEQLPYQETIHEECSESTVEPDWKNVAQAFSDNVETWRSRNQSYQEQPIQAKRKKTISSSKHDIKPLKQQTWVLAYTNSEPYEKSIVTNTSKSTGSKKTKKEKRAEKQEKKEKQKAATKRMASLRPIPHVVNTGGPHYYMYSNNSSKSIHTYSGGDVRPK